MANKYKYKYPTLSSPTAHSSAQGQEASVTEDSINDPEFVSFVSLSYNLKFDSTLLLSDQQKQRIWATVKTGDFCDKTWDFQVNNFITVDVLTVWHETRWTFTVQPYSVCITTHSRKVGCGPISSS